MPQGGFPRNNGARVIYMYCFEMTLAVDPGCKALKINLLELLHFLLQEVVNCLLEACTGTMFGRIPMEESMTKAVYWDVKVQIK